MVKDLIIYITLANDERELWDVVQAYALGSCIICTNRKMVHKLKHHGRVHLNRVGILGNIYIPPYHVDITVLDAKK